MTNPRNESLREPLRNECLGPSGLGIEAWKRAKSGKSLFSTLVSAGDLLHELVELEEKKGNLRTVMQEARFLHKLLGCFE